MTAAVHLLRRLHSAGWQHTRYTTFGIHEHVYTRNRLAINEQRICLNENTDGWRVEVRIGGRVLSGSGFDVADWDMAAGWLGVFEPAPAPIYPPLTYAQRKVRDEVLRRAATDPAVSDDVFAVLAPAIERRPL